MTALGPCAICEHEPATVVCPDFIAEGPLCAFCHAARRTAFRCACLTIMQALSLTSSAMPEAVAQVLTRASRLTTPEIPMKKKTKKNGANGAFDKMASLAEAVAPLTTAAGEDKPVERARYEEMVLVLIKAEDIEARAADLAKVIGEREDTLERKRESNAAYREKLAYYDERLSELAEQVRTKKERRPVECVEYLFPRVNEVRVIRTDTGEIVSSRAATPEDLQEGLPGIGGEGEDDADEKTDEDEDDLVAGDRERDDGPQPTAHA